ncbi:nicotinate-nucleotide adenylyltransferase [Denitratisoma oestradiolicum]|uniref:Probable nicotinate-nucleotide adenylyltransferase n=1 Tax=Denitratisoma oestradiolicum TaxID=311182 RepID=A0A6S6YCG6_9PROT|nr:nicotinate-nucleotide adenylyltransferase [Denitratisoma oestradiolicum]TWO79316.1 nicotinic acid mononucleotide adenylyltransferase [Denitratisoma oestradiolicum]CAB1370356.1 putative nicotinate-nucleotide adenylyltransferase [Denitratisoma oestradiolicum]
MSLSATPEVDRRPIGILGGTFDPIHYGHLRLAEEAREHLGLQRVLLIPAGQPAHRRSPVADGCQRLAMVRLAVENNSFLEVDTAEIDSLQSSYTVPTLERLRAKLGAQQSLVLVLGADAFLGLASWHRWRELFGLAHLAVATRPGHDLDAGAMSADLVSEFGQRLAPGREALVASGAGCILPFAITPLDISATAIRQTLAAGGSVRYLLPDGTLDYIHHHSLYRVSR